MVRKRMIPADVAALVLISEEVLEIMINTCHHGVLKDEYKEYLTIGHIKKLHKALEPFGKGEECLIG